jgi:hypothetical protein
MVRTFDEGDVRPESHRPGLLEDDNSLARSPSMAAVEVLDNYAEMVVRVADFPALGADLFRRTSARINRLMPSSLIIRLAAPPASVVRWFQPEHVAIEMS